MTSTDIVRITPDQVEDVLLHGGDLAVVDTNDIQDDMVTRILSSESLAGAFASFESVPARDIEGVLVEVRGVAWMRSAFKEGPQVYALLRCLPDKAKDEVIVSMGGRTTMASFLWAQRNEAMPFKGTFRQLRSKSDPEKSYWTFVLA